MLTCLLGLGTVNAQAPTTSPAGGSTQSHPAHPKNRKSAVHAKQAQPATDLVPPPAPPPPAWPVNDPANHAAVTWDSQGLRIQATNSSLQQILRDVSVATGAKVEGMGADQRVYGDYGPGQARDVLSQLLVGSGYNVLLAGDLGQGAPSQILLSPRRATGNSPNGANRPAGDNGDEEPDNEVEEQPQPQPQPQIQQPIRPGFTPAGPPRTPQQIMQEMQQRQMQQQQLQQLQQIQQQQQANPTTAPQN